MDFEKNREWATKINEKLEHSNPSSIVSYFEEIEKKWNLNNDNGDNNSINNSINNSFIKISNNFNIKILTI